MIEKAGLFPPLAISTEPTTRNLTGSWRFERPVFVDLIAPCAEACPLGQDSRTIMALIARGDFQGALGRILLENPFPGLTGRICPARCERACNRGRFDQPVSIKDLELFLAGEIESGLAGDIPKTGKKIALFGSGPPILTAAWFLHDLGHEIVFFDKNKGLPDFGQAGHWRREIEKLLARGMTIEPGSPEEFNDLIRNPQGFDAVCIQEAPEGPPDDKVLGAVQFRRLLKEKRITPENRVTIIGHGRQAAKTAALLQELEVDHTVLTNRFTDDCPGLAADREKIKGNIRVLGLKGKKEDDGVLVAVGDDEEFEIPTDLVVLAMGQRNDPWLSLPRFVSGLPLVELAPINNKDYNSGLLEAMARAKGAAMALDLALKRRSIEDITRCLAGGRGAISFEAYLNPETDLAGREIASYNLLNTSCFTRQERLSPKDEVFNRQEAGSAAARCFNCGLCTFCGLCAEYCPDLSISVDQARQTRLLDYDHCKGCGICAEECPRGVIGWVPE